jgi:hypothetical protein
MPSNRFRNDTRAWEKSHCYILSENRTWQGGLKPAATGERVTGCEGLLEK